MNKYVIVYQGKGLMGWYPNNNFYGSVKDIIRFSTKQYYTFDTYEEAELKTMQMLIDMCKMEGEIKLSFKVYDIVKKLTIIEMKGGNT